MKKSYAMGAVAAIVLAMLLGVGYWYQQSGSTETSVTPESTNGEVVPTTSTNPLDNKPNINPIDQTNPFNNVKTNPFE